MNDLVPSEFRLSQNYPNPFTKKTTIKYCVPYKTKVRIIIYDSEGEMIEKLVDEKQEAGTYEVEFYRVSGIRHLLSGTYFCQMKAGDYLSEKKMMLAE
jgi:hypothetical protein